MSHREVAISYIHEALDKRTAITYSSGTGVNYSYNSYGVDFRAYLIRFFIER